MRGEVWFGLLGPLCAIDAGSPRPLPAAKLRAILAALLVRVPHDVSVEELVDAVWPDAPPRNPRAALHTYLNRLRQTLGPALAGRLVTTTGGYRVDAAADELDVSAFEGHRTTGLDALRAGDPDAAGVALRAAVDLWRGDALADIPASRLRDEHATRLAELRTQTWESYMDAELALGHDKEAIGELRRLVRAYPLRERFAEQLMLALYRCDQQADALTVYQESQAALHEELGVRPGPALRGLYERILAQDPTLRGAEEARPAAGSRPRREPATRPAQLPATAADFTGREAQITALRAALGDATAGPAVATLSGIAGVGKTALAVHVAHLVRDRYQDGQLFVDLRGTSANPPRPDDLLARILRDLGVAAGRIPVDLDERVALYRSMLAERRMLLVLDDARDAAQVHPLIPGGRDCAVLVTSRAALATLPTRYRCVLDPFAAPEAVALLGRIVGDQRVAGEPAAAADIVAACDRLPLAIRIAAARMLTRPTGSVRAFAEVLADATARLDLLEADDLGVRASFAVSYEQLGRSPEAARAFRLSGLWTGSDLTIDAVAAMLDVTPSAAQDALAELVDAHLLTRPAPARFRAHDLMRAYAAERAAIEEAPDDRTAAVRRLLVWYLGRTEAAAAVLNPVRAASRRATSPAATRPVPFDDPEAALAWLDTEAANLVAATDLASEYGQHDLAGELPIALFDWLLRRLDYGAWVGTHQVGLASARAIGDDWLESRLLNNLSGAYLRSWRPAQALAVLEEAVELHRRRGDRYAEAVTLSNMVNAYFQLGRMDEAQAAALETIRRYREVGRPDNCGQPLIALGEIHRSRGELDESSRYATEALEVSRAAGDRTTEGHALANLGHTALALGRPAEAAANYQAAIAVADSDGDRYTAVEATEGLGDASEMLGDPAAARRYWTQAWETYRDISDERAHRLAERLSRQ